MKELPGQLDIFTGETEGRTVDFNEHIPTGPKQRDTSRKAAQSMQSVIGGIRADVLEHFRSVGLNGATCDETEVALGLSHQTCSASVNWLHNHKLIRATEARRATRSGRSAIVWIAVTDKD